MDSALVGVIVCFGFPFLLAVGLLGAVTWMQQWEQEQELRRQERRARLLRGLITSEDVLEEARRWAERQEQ